MTFEVIVNSALAFSGHLVLELFTRAGLLVSRSDAQGSPIDLRPGRNVIVVDLNRVPLLDGVYDLNVGVVDHHGHTVVAWSDAVAAIQVSYGGRESGIVALGATIRQS